MRCRAEKHPDKVFRELTALVYATATDTDSWSDVLDQLSADCGAINTHLFGQDYTTGNHLGILHAGYDPAFIDSYERHYGAINTWGPGMLALPVGETRNSELICPDQQVIKTEFYADWVQPQDDIRAGGGVVLYRDATRMYLLGGNIRYRHVDTLVDPFLMLIERLTPHMQHAIDIGRALSGRKLETIALASPSSDIDTAVFALRQNGDVLFANAKAAALIEDGELVAMDPLGKIAMTDRRAMHALRTLWRQDGDTSTQACTFCVEGHRGSTYDCRGVLLDPARIGVSPLGIRAGNDAPFLLLTLTRAPDRQVQNILMQRYGLTRREAAVASLLHEGKSAHDIATESSRSIHTIRDQIKSAMRKTGCSRQSALVSQMGALFTEHD